MSTETISPRYAALDAWPVEDVAAALADSQLAAAAAARNAAPAIARAARAAIARLAQGKGRLVYAGAGTSGRIGAQDGVELGPTYDWPADRLLYFIAGGDAALTRAIEGAEDDRAAAIAQTTRAGLGPQDVMIALAASGRTPFAVAAAQAARQAGALSIGVANTPGAPLLEAAAHPVLLDTGAEVVAGSTRMAAGTAQKIALNMLSTAIMIGLGRVHGNLMVDLASDNVKLARRRVEITRRIADCAAPEAEAALAQSGGRIKVAALMLLRGLSPAQAQAALTAQRGVLRKALES